MINEEKINREAQKKQSELASSIYQNYPQSEKQQLKKRLNQIEEQEKKEKKEEQIRQMKRIKYYQSLARAGKEMKLNHDAIKLQFEQMSSKNKDGSVSIGIK